MPDNACSKMLFIINPSSGTGKTNWKQEIVNFFKDKHAFYEIFELTGKEDKDEIEKKLAEYNPYKVIAVGGDGTVKIIVEALLHTEMILGILPAGSANGMATELGIKDEAQQALDVIVNGKTQKIDVLKLNDKNLSIHLSDIGLNAMLVHYFEKGNQRGMLGYARVMFKVFRKKRLMRLAIQVNGENISRAAYMAVMANARTYGTGAVINPEGNISDGKFELIIMRKINLVHLFRMLVSHKPFDKDCIETIHAEKAVITSAKRNHFQVDGEYCGKTDKVIIDIIPSSLNVLVPY
jgi:YegS/Rv2252/BmrU family lipid kinase